MISCDGSDLRWGYLLLCYHRPTSYSQQWLLMAALTEFVMELIIHNVDIVSCLITHNNHKTKDRCCIYQVYDSKMPMPRCQASHNTMDNHSNPRSTQINSTVITTTSHQPISYHSIHYSISLYKGRVLRPQTVVDSIKHKTYYYSTSWWAICLL